MDGFAHGGNMGAAELSQQDLGVSRAVAEGNLHSCVCAPDANTLPISANSLPRAQSSLLQDSAGRSPSSDRILY
jgi:hypothetical protein